MRISSFLLAAAIVSSATMGAADDDAQVYTWSGDVARIMHENCVTCHRPGEIGPMSLMTYEDVRPWAKSIRKSVSEREMPPWHPDNTKVKYANDPSLSDEDIEKVVRWVDAGSPMGDPAAAPAPPEFPGGWMMGGEPDMIFHSTTKYLVPAHDNNIEYTGFIFDTSALTEDLWISAWELRPTAVGVVHHANLAMSPVPFDNTAGGDVIGQAARPGGDYVGSYLPGCRPMEYPEGTAYLLPKGANLAIQMHFVGGEKDVECGMMFGVKFAQGRIDKRVRIVGLIGVDGNIDIKPFEKDYILAAQATLLYDTTILSSGAHMHTRGAAYEHIGITPDGTQRIITEVPRYDFNWQQTYWLAEPLNLPKGSLVRTVAHYDNTADNPTNVDPSQRVVHGPWTSDEMLNSWAHSVVTNETLGLKLEDGRVVGKFDDAQKRAHPMILQSLKCDVLSEDGSFKEIDLSGIVKEGS